MSWIDNIRKEIESMGYSAKNAGAVDWLLGKMKNLAARPIRNRLQNDEERSAASTIMGRMYFYAYDAKHKKTLPYYDRFPLVFPIERYDDGFLGLNLHYLNYRDRAVLLKNLTEFRTNDKWDQTTRLRMTYNAVQRASKFNMAKPCIKRYLYTQVRSQFIEINANEWYIAIFLPVDNFSGASARQVHKDSRDKF